jgi:hypothetical protein
MDGREAEKVKAFPTARKHHTEMFYSSSYAEVGDAHVSLIS